MEIPLESPDYIKTKLQSLNLEIKPDYEVGVKENWEHIKAIAQLFLDFVDDIQ